MLKLTPFADVLRLAWYAARGGQDDALREIETHLERLDPLRRLGADIDQRIQDAAMLEAAGVPSEDVPVIAKIWSRGTLTAEDLHQLHARGINVQPAVDWARRTGRPTPAPAASVEPPRLIEEVASKSVQYMVQGPLGTREVPALGDWAFEEEPVARRRVRHITQTWLGRHPDGRLLPTAADDREISLVEREEPGPWEAI